jgi:hypothetical protein
MCRVLSTATRVLALIRCIWTHIRRSLAPVRITAERYLILWRMTSSISTPWRSLFMECLEAELQSVAGLQWSGCRMHGRA